MNRGVADGGEDIGMVDEAYRVVIGLEVHVELKTRTKLFCRCVNAFGSAPNTQTCPVCLGLPGVLPVLNRNAVSLAVKAGMALHCRIRSVSKFDRKQYFYPDLPKAYQISQYDLPFAEWGFVPIADGAEVKRIRIRRVHMEEDAGKLNHIGQNLKEAEGSLVDLNRAGVPLIEIVSEPDMGSAEEARRYLTELRTILSYLDVSDLRMEEGSMRCDANVSLKPRGYQGSLEDLPRVEVKNVNSIRNVGRAIEYEIERQAARLSQGERVIKETRGFDDGRGRTYSQRSKEEANDYRYFPEPDLPPLVLDESWLAEVQASLPLLPDAWRERLRGLGVASQDVEVLVQDRVQVAFLSEALSFTDDVRAVSSWMLSDMLRLLNERGLGFDQSPVSPKDLVDLLGFIADGKISGRMAKEVLDKMFESGESAAVWVKRLGMAQITDDSLLRGQVAEVLAEHGKVVADYRAGKERAFGFLVGQMMKRTQGQASPEVVNRLLKEALEFDAQ